MSRIIRNGNFGPFSHYKKIVECDNREIYNVNREIYTVSGITRPEYIYGLTPFIKYEIMVFNKDKDAIYEECFSENEYDEFMNKCAELALNLENYIKEFKRI